MDDKRYQPQSGQAMYLYLNAGMRLDPSCIPPVKAVQDGGQIGNLWEHDYEKRGLKLNAQPCIAVDS